MLKQEIIMAAVSSKSTPSNCYVDFGCKIPQYLGFSYKYDEIRLHLSEEEIVAFTKNLKASDGDEYIKRHSMREGCFMPL